MVRALRELLTWDLPIHPPKLCQPLRPLILTSAVAFHVALQLTHLTSPGSRQSSGWPWFELGVALVWVRGGLGLS